ncbi:uncharacterized protein PGTG_12924 [Puccinia graminis f. sp. tritici CRL 75-36-700-3]|uniref:Uncharacterized protein n=1 Tax=Puccinia graminis f. sp. tritici (strain CRL 75-36-700-3 / race SCCL) TaxID=418459 RepID=E3KSQ4_PUCGT|nr:uncharacterized protein PGTG_12924 [Puccinia graminis f. sp. tritici CRL 75-36-700-3]EFP87340.1 hypothetical protein PGTG_12924 [Puccinia graminis f. sp. tritici CRL 75-36-700-3]
MANHPGGRRKIVKIKPLDRNLGYDGSNMPIEEFISKYEEAAETVGASSQDLASQILFFIRGPDLQDEVEEMHGYEECNWVNLKEELTYRFGITLTLEECSREELVDLVSYVANMGGIRTPEPFRQFILQFEHIAHYLIENGYNSSMDEFAKLFWQSLSPELERAISDPLIWDCHLVLDENFHIAEIPSYGVILEYIDREFNKLDKIQEDCDQPAQEIGQNNPYQFPQWSMEHFNSEFQSPLTETSTPVLSSNLDAFPLTLENGQSLETLEPLDNTETKQFGSETEVISAKIPSEISLPYAIIEENCSPVAPVTLEFPPQILEICKKLDPFDRNQSAYLGSESETCAENIDNLPVGPVNLESSPQLIANDQPLATLEPWSITETEYLGSESAIFAEPISPEETFPVYQVEKTPVNPIPESQNPLQILMEDKNEEKFSQSIKPEDVSVLDSVQSIQSPTINSTRFAPEGIGTPEEPISNIAPNLSLEIDYTPNSQLNSMENLVAEPLFKDSIDGFFSQKPVFIPSKQVFDPQRNFNKTLGTYNKETDPGEATEMIPQSASITKILTESVSPTTHQVPPHQQELPPSKAPDNSQIFLQPPWISSGKTGTRNIANFKKKRIKSNSINHAFSVPNFFPSSLDKLAKDNLQYIWFRDRIKRKELSNLHVPQTSARNKSKGNLKRKKTRIRFGRHTAVIIVSESKPSSGLFETQKQAIDAGATSFASLALDDLDRSLTEKKTLRRCSYKIVLLVRIAGYTPSIHPDLPKPDTIGIEATNFASLSFARSVWNASKKRKKILISNVSRWMVQRSKKRGQSILPKYMLKSFDCSRKLTRESSAIVVSIRFKYQDRKTKEKRLDLLHRSWKFVRILETVALPVRSKKETINKGWVLPMNSSKHSIWRRISVKIPASIGALDQSEDIPESMVVAFRNSFKRYWHCWELDWEGRVGWNQERDDVKHLSGLFYPGVEHVLRSHIATKVKGYIMVQTTRNKELEGLFSWNLTEEAFNLSHQLNTDFNPIVLAMDTSNLNQMMTRPVSTLQY